MLYDENDAGVVAETITEIRKDQQLVKRNVIVNSICHKLNVHTERIFAIIISQIKPNDDSLGRYVIPVSLLRKALGLKGRSLYESVKESCKELLSCQIYLHTDDKKGKTKWKGFNLFSFAGYEEGGYVDVMINNQLKSYFLNLKGNFTRSMNVIKYIKLKNRYQMKIYEIIMDNDYKYEGKQTIYPLEELKEIIGISKEKYPRYGELKKRVLEPTRVALKKRTNVINYEMKTFKVGHKVKNVQFCKIEVEHDKKSKQSNKKPINKKNNITEILSNELSYASNSEKAQFKKCVKRAKGIDLEKIMFENLPSLKKEK